MRSLDARPVIVSRDRLRRPLDSPRAYGEILLFGIRIRPYQVRHWTFVWNFSEPVDDFDLINVMDRGTESTVYAEYVVIDDDAEGEKVKHVGKGLPDGRRAVLSRTFEVKAIGL